MFKVTTFACFFSCRGRITRSVRLPVSGYEGWIKFWTKGNLILYYKEGVTNRRHLHIRHTNIFFLSRRSRRNDKKAKTMGPKLDSGAQFRCTHDINTLSNKTQVAYIHTYIRMRNTQQFQKKKTKSNRQMRIT